MKSLAKRILPPGTRLAIRRSWPWRFLVEQRQKKAIREWRLARSQGVAGRPGNDRTPGINLIGCLRAAKGIGEAARNTALALRAAAIPFGATDFELGIPSSLQTEVFVSPPGRRPFEFSVNLIHLNPPELVPLWEAHGKANLGGRYNIAVWYWELPRLPGAWQFAFDLVDEVWVGSQFIHQSVLAESTVPVVDIPPCIQPQFDPSLSRADFALPADCFLFLCAFDVLSDVNRKNPFGVVEAFKRAFSPGESSVGLVIKIINASLNPAAVAALRTALVDYPNSHFIEEHLSSTRMHSLINLIDVYASLHRAEGFGLIPAEAMFLGKPVVLTRWSGNADFMTEGNCCGVDYRLVPIRMVSGPYQSGQVWADPDLDQAAAYFRRLASDPDYCAAISEQAASTIRSRYSPQVTGRAMRARLEALNLL